MRRRGDAAQAGGDGHQVVEHRVIELEAGLEEQFRLSRAIYEDELRTSQALHAIAALREQMQAKSGKATLGSAGEGLEIKLHRIAGEPGEGGHGSADAPPTLASVRLQLARLEVGLQSADAAPTTAQAEAYASLQRPVADLMRQWDALQAGELKTLNERRRTAGLALLSLDTKKIEQTVSDQIDTADEP